jgi:hypothetical protein
MSTVSPAEPRPGPKPAAARGGNRSESTPAGLRVIDGTLLLLFLALTFLLGIFPLKDADIYWHLRTGDLIRKTGAIPRVDFYTFTRQGTPWIDLHWMFQVGVSWLREHGGAPSLTLAKAVITCLAVFFLATSRRRSWPIWAVVLAWVPALLVLGGRMYVRPETLSLLYLSIYLAVLCRWDRFPALAWLLPFVQVAWVNSQGLFVLGPVILGFALCDAAIRPGAFAAGQGRWWQTVVAASAATGLACLVNPYGVHGAIYPLELAGTMSNPIFSRSIAELTPIPLFIRKAGLGNLPLQLHLATMVLGALSFLLPIFWLAWTRLRGPGADGNGEAVAALEPPGGDKRARKASGEAKASRPARKARRKKGETAMPLAEPEGSWRISPFRLLLFAAFSFLSLQATRNSHQFATVVGTVTAWNFAQWAAARRNLGRPDSALFAPGSLRPRLVALFVLGAAFVLVGSGMFYRLTGEGRTIGWGEEPLWFPHEACKFAGTDGMPDRFLSYHNAHASVFEFYHSPERPDGPGRTVYTDPRLEVAGADLFERYQTLGKEIADDAPGWEAKLEQMERPSIMVDHENNAQIGATLLGSRRWKCVWFDPIVAVYVHDRYAGPVEKHAVDFAARHFRPDPATEPHGLPALLATAKALRNYANFAVVRGNFPRPLIWLGLDYARRIVEADPDSVDGWKTIAQIESNRDPFARPTPRFRMPFDPVFDLSPVRSTYAYRRALELAPRDFMAVMGLANLYEAREMREAMLPLLDRLVELPTINQLQRMQQSIAESNRIKVRQELGRPPRETWKNLAELDQIVTEQLAAGRVATVVALLERAYPAEKAPWEIVDRIATLRLHLGYPEDAAALWQGVSSVPTPAVRDARIGAALLAMGDMGESRKAYEQALAADANLFEARYGLAVLEQDAGRASAAYEHARAAIDSATTDAGRAAARAVASAVSRFARKEASGAVSLNRDHRSE